MSYSVRNRPASPSNYTQGRQGNKVSEIIIHHAASTSFDSISQVFSNPNRGASAHYAVGRNNNVDKMVDESNTAWHCGNWPHNTRSIGIENVNSSGAPNWSVAKETKDTLVELCADIVRRNPGIGKLVPGKNLFGHKQVSDKPTACPVTLIAFLPELADRVNKLVSGGGSSTPSKPTQPSGPRKSNEVVASEVMAGAWGNNPERKQRLQAAGYDYGAIQAIVNARVNGAGAPARPAKPSVATIAQQVIAGAWGNGDERKTRLKNAGYDYATVQAEVNRRLGIQSAGGSARKTNEQIANEIIAGQGGWGNNPGRREKLQKAGYDYNAVQAIVNRKLGF